MSKAQLTSSKPIALESYIGFNRRPLVISHYFNRFSLCYLCIQGFLVDGGIDQCILYLDFFLKEKGEDVVEMEVVRMRLIWRLCKNKSFSKMK